MNINSKIIDKLSSKKYRREFSLCLVEGAKIIRDNPHLVAKIIDENNAVFNVPKNTIHSDRFLVLDRIQDPGNMGTILRTAAAFGFNTVYEIDCVDPYSPKVLRASSGMVFNLNIIEATFETLPDKPLFVADMHGETPGVSPKEFGIVLSNEGQGVDERFLKLPNAKIAAIPMASGVESLNVAVAGGILMYLLAF
jgi:TrmH family RNA methyltransferase